MLFSIPLTEMIEHSGDRRKTHRIYYHDKIIHKISSRHGVEDKSLTFVESCIGMLLVERIKDVLQSSIPHPLRTYLEENLSKPFDTYRIDQPWLTMMILGNLTTTPEYQILAVGFVIQPLYFEILNMYYNFGNSKYVIDEAVDELSRDGSFLLHLRENFELYST